MIGLFVGPSGSGKTFFARRWLLPILLTRPRDVTSLAPERFKGVLLDDPRSRRWPEGQYAGARYRDVAQWEQSAVKSRVSCFDSATPRALCKLALKLGDVVLGFDEIDFAMSSRTVYRDGSDGRPADPEFVITQKGRHEGIFLFGGCRRLHDVHVRLRTNLQIAWFANLTEPDDRNYAADMARIPKQKLSMIPRAENPEDPRYFVEWRKETDKVFLVHLELDSDDGSIRRVAERLR